MPVLTVGETRVAYNLRRSKVAKSARLSVTPEGIDLVVPDWASDKDIAGVLERRRGWLVEQSKAITERIAAAPKVGRFVTGAKIPYRGRQMRLTVEPFEAALVDVSYRSGFLVRVPEQLPEPSRDPIIETAIRLWLRKRLREDVAAYVRAHGERNGMKPKGILIKDQKHLWGNCGNDRKIHLNWHLIFAPKPVLEYAVVHELCHLRERNHDRAFWGLVGSILPDWEARKGWLDENEHVLGWRRIEPARQ
jgi:predicted metal-dependent hydrolase